jgi:protein-disulfide isomerase
VEYDDERHKDACFYSKLAMALWMVDASKFKAFHQFLFDNQNDMTRDKALAEAHDLVGRARLEGMRVDERIDKLLKRDIELAARLGVMQLPGILIGDQVFTYMGPEPSELAEKFRKAFEP